MKEEGWAWTGAGGTPLLPALVESYHGTLVSAQLCGSQGAALFSFIHASPRLSRPFARTPVRSMSLTHVQRLRAAGCGLKCKLISLGMHRTTRSTATSASTTVTSITACMTATHQTRYFEPQSNGRARHKLIQSCVRRVASKAEADGCIA